LDILFTIALKCTETKQVYRNRSSRRKDVTLTVDDKCDGGKGGPQVIVNDGRGHAVERYDMPPGGDTETFTVPGGGSLDVTRVGFQGDGRTFSVVAVSPARPCCLFF
jgi:hypothetical protein